MTNVSQERLSLCEHNLYHCYRCETKLLKLVITELEAERDRYKAALEWYADPMNWEFDWTDATVAAADDDGQRARKALEGGSSNV